MKEDIDTVRQGLDLCPDDWPIQNKAALVALARVEDHLAETERKLVRAEATVQNFMGEKDSWGLERR